MRNDSHRWRAPTPLSRVGEGVTVTQVDVGGQFVVSAPDVRVRYGDRLIAWPDPISRPSHVLSMRRDRVLVVGEDDLKTGFQNGLAVTDMTDAFDVIDLTGPNAFEALRKGAEIRLDQPSPSVVRRVFGVELLLCRLQDAGFRLHIPRSLSQAVVEMLVKG